MTKAYYLPQTTDEALELLKKHNGSAAIVCGGTDLIVQMKSGAKQFDVLVDISRIPALNTMQEEEDTIVIGGAVTHARVANAPFIQKYATALAQGCGIVGSPQIRNVGSLSGNIVNAQPAADSAIALIALEAEATICGSASQRTCKVEALYQDVGKSRVDYCGEIITALRFAKLDPARGEASAVQRLSQRNMLSLPMLNVAVALKISAKETIDWVRISIGPVARTPFRNPAAEKIFEGAPATEAVFREIGDYYRLLANPRSSRLRGGADYRKEMVSVLTERALRDAAATVRG